MNNIKWITQWYKNNCDGDWEHMYGVKIDTLDNPGWRVHIDLVDTSLENKPFEEIHIDVDDNNWIFCKVSDNVFHGHGNAHKLDAILDVFRKWSKK